MGNKFRESVAFAVSCIFFFLSIFWIGTHGPVGKEGYLFVFAYLLSFTAMFGIWHFWPFKSKTRLIIIFLAVAARVPMYPFPVSDDMNRYIWEGKIQNSGYNPYLLSPDSEKLKNLRDENWKGINHKNISAIYPPFAQIVFRTIAAASQNPAFFRLFFIAANIVLIFILFSLAGILGLPEKHILLYALNPLVLVFAAGEGHYEPLYVSLVFASLLAFYNKYDRLSFFLLGMATVTKIIPIIFLPFLINKRNWKKTLYFLIPFGLLIPYWSGTEDLFFVIKKFGTEFNYNGFIFSILSVIFENHTASLLCGVVFLALCLSVFFFTPHTLRAFFLVAGSFLLCLPTLHPWYLILIAAFLPFFFSLPWFVLLAATAASFATRMIFMETGTWTDYPLSRLIEYGCFIAFGLLGILKNRTAFPRVFPGVGSVSVIIPALNEKENIEACIRSIKEQKVEKLEIIVADGGSSDGTLELLKKINNIKLVSSKRGRGIQIATGIKDALNDVVLIIHADSRLLPNSVERMLNMLNSRPQAIGGCFGQSYEKAGIKYRFISIANNLRAFTSGMSFGDQGQFFRRNELKGGFPDFWLMEDVELSFRMKNSGALLFISGGIVCSTRRWKRVGYSSNMLKVVRLFGKYLLLRKFNRISDGCKLFYKEYYSYDNLT